MSFKEVINKIREDTSYPIEELEKLVVDSMYADTYTDLRIFDYIAIINDDRYKDLREEILAEIEDRLENPVEASASNLRSLYDQQVLGGL